MKSHGLFSVFCVAMLATVSVDAGSEPKPADLVDLETIRQEESREEIDGVLVLSGSWLGPMYRGLDADSQPAPGHLTESAKVFIPVGEAAGTEISQIVYARHEAQFLKETYDASVELPSVVPVAILHHGQYSQDWLGRGFTGRDHWVRHAVNEVMSLNRCTPNDYRPNYVVSLVETQLMALSLLSRLLEGEGYAPGPAAVRGISKEGSSTWLASAIDDRIVVAAPGGYHWEDLLEAKSVDESNRGCNASIEWLRWMETTEAGEASLKYFSVVEFAAELKPEFLLLYGDVGLAKMHDGIYFTTGEETHFLENFAAVPFRYDRVPDLSNESSQNPQQVRETQNAFRSRILVLLAHYLLTGDTTSYPKIVDSWAEATASSFQATARVDPAPQAVRLWWSHSFGRDFNNDGNAPWISVEMALEGDHWISPSVDLPAGMMIGWYVEAESTLEWEGFSVAQRDTSPQRFFNEFPPKTCSTPPPDCSPPAPPTGVAAVGKDSRVVLQWGDNTESDLRGYRVKRAEISGDEYVVVSSLVRGSEYTATDVVNGETYYYVVTAVDRSTNESEPSAEAEATPLPVPFLRGDCDGDRNACSGVNDALTLLSWLFRGDTRPPCVAACDTDGNGETELTDAVYGLDYCFTGTAPPAAPFPGCGPGTKSDVALGCDAAPGSCQ
jgi:hypothetical protein